MVRIVFIDDDPDVHTVLRTLVPDECAVIPALNGAQGIRLVAEEDPDLVLLDSGLPDIDGMQVLRRILALPSPPPVVMLSVSCEVGPIVESIKAGAYDYLLKPLSPARILPVLRSAVRWRARREALIDDTSIPQLIGRTPAMREVRRRIALYASSSSPVLITGETGTGKDVAARAIHALSGRDQARYLPLNCGAMPDTLVETELFGCERGAYTDAIAKAGFIERAHRGTLFLDEIGEMAPHLQVKLLRVIESKSFTRVGGTHSTTVDVRILTATNRPLTAAVRAGGLRMDLYYRVSTLLLPIPPLRERREDIPELAYSFLAVHVEESGHRVTISASALDRLVGYDWPGNVRQLRNVIERAFLFVGEGPILERHLLFDPSVDRLGSDPLPGAGGIEHP